MSKGIVFPVSVTPVAKDGGYVQIAFLYEEFTIGTITVRDILKISTIDFAWHDVLKEATFKPNVEIPQFVRSALATMSKEYRAGVPYKELTWKFLSTGSIYDWEITGAN